MPSSQIRLRCSEIWGGIRNADVDVCTNGLTASLYASASGAAQGGDIYYFAVCSSDMLTRIVIADLRGHGADASELSEWVYRALRDSMNTRDGNVVLKHLNSLLYQHGFTALTTAAVVGFYAADSHLYVSSAGHPPTLLRCRDGGPWRAVEITSSAYPANLPLGVFAETSYDQERILMQPGDRFALYTDGVLEHANREDEQFGLERLLRLLEEHRGQDLATVKHAILETLVKHGGSAVEDDLTFLLAEVSAPLPSSVFCRA